MLQASKAYTELVRNDVTHKEIKRIELYQTGQIIIDQLAGIRSTPIDS